MMVRGEEALHTFLTGMMRCPYYGYIHDVTANLLVVYEQAIVAALVAVDLDVFLHRRRT